MSLAIRAQGISKHFNVWQRHTHLSDLFGSTFKKKKDAEHNGLQDGLLWALQDVSFEVQEGELIGVIGRNGSGKTTLLKIISRITPPSAGTVELYGRVAALLEVGTGFHPELTGRENVFLNGSILGMKKAEIQTKFDEIIEFSGLEKFLDVAVKRYSTGMYLRLAFAVAAHLQPEIILVDEVLAVGDADFQRKCMGKMDSVSKEGRTVLLVSHQLNAIRKLCKRCLWIDGGRVAMIGATNEVLAAYETSVAGARAAERDGVSGGDSPRFLNWRIAGSTEDTANYLLTTEAVTVDFELYAPTALSNMMIHLSLWNQAGQLMWGFHKIRLDFDPGTHKVSFAFSGIPLRPGVYNWEISLWHWQDFTMIDSWRALPEMIIATEPLAHQLDEFAGILNVPCEVTTEQTT